MSRTNTSDEDTRELCSFFWKTGTCRHGDQCCHKHIHPTSSKCVLLPHMYIPPPPGDPSNEQQWFEDFMEDVLDEADKIGKVEEMVVLQNTCEHLIGHVYIRFSTEADAQRCIQQWTGRYFRWISLAPSFSPVTDFTESRCRQHDENECTRGGLCNFMHMRVLPPWLLKRLYWPLLFFQELRKNNYPPELWETQLARHQQLDAENKQSRFRGYNSSNSNDRYSDNSGSSSSRYGDSTRSSDRYERNSSDRYGDNGGYSRNSDRYGDNDRYGQNSSRSTRDYTSRSGVSQRGPSMYGANGGGSATSSTSTSTRTTGLSRSQGSTTSTSEARIMAPPRPTAM